MRFHLARGSTFLLAASLLLPAGLWAATTTCSPAAPTAASYTWDFPGEANQLFEQIRDDAARVSRSADELTEYSRTYQVDWQLQGEDLELAKESVNRMGANLCRLQSIQGAVLPWQQKAIGQMAPIIHSLVDNTQQAITLLNQNQDRLFATAYGQRIHSVFQESHAIRSAVDRTVQYAQLRNKLNQLGGNPTASGL